jgi:MFS family permease
MPATMIESRRAPRAQAAGQDAFGPQLPGGDREAVAKRRQRALLVLVCLAQLMVILDVSIVNVALPSIRDGLRFSTTGLQWVVNAYTLTFAGFLLLGGRAADLLGRRRVFLAGTALFALASLACALADSRALLIGARALQGVGGAVISPASLAIIATSFKEGGERSRALGVWGAMGGLGGSLGVLLGGVLTQAFGWPAIFLVNVPIGLAVIACSRGLIPAGRASSASRHFDAAGALLITGGLTALVYAIVRTDTLGWGATGVLVPLAIGAALIGAFVFVEGRVAREPLMPLRVFGMARLRAANLIMFLLYASVFAIWFFLSLYLQQVLHCDALQTGLRFLPMTLAIMLASTLAPRLVAAWGERRVLSAGMLCAAVRPVPAHGRPQRRQLQRGRAPGRRARRDRPRAFARAGDDRGGGGGIGARERARVRHAQHLASDRRRARPCGAEHDRGVANARGPARRRVRPGGSERRLSDRVRGCQRRQPARRFGGGHVAAPRPDADRGAGRGRRQAARRLTRSRVASCRA